MKKSVSSIPRRFTPGPLTLPCISTVPKWNSVATGKSSSALIVHPQEGQFLLRNRHHAPSPRCHFTRESRRACFHASTRNSRLYTALVHHHILTTTRSFLLQPRRSPASACFRLGGSLRPSFMQGTGIPRPLTAPLNAIDPCRLPPSGSYRSTD